MAADMAPGPVSDRPLPPGSTIGILGGGQLGRMLGLAAARLGLKTHIYSDVREAPAGDVTDLLTVGGFTDRDRLEAFAKSVDVVTFEFENVPVAAADIVSPITPIFPPREALARTQDRLIEKQFVEGLGIPVAPFAAVDDKASLEQALDALGRPAFLKTRRFGYDGKGQVRIDAGADAGAALTAIGGTAAILEGLVRFDCEISVIAVRGRRGDMAFYDCPRNRHSEGILRQSTVPAGVPAAVTAEARGFARRIGEALDYVGVIGVELFYCESGSLNSLIVNEIAPRVHNSGHWTMDACTVSQFENHIRAVAGWPLGATERHSDAEMTNLIGAEAADWAQLAAEPGTALHLYGKKDARPGRKMGHVNRISPLGSTRS